MSYSDSHGHQLAGEVQAMICTVDGSWNVAKVAVSSNALFSMRDHWQEY
jgi:hypothetical protein